MTLIYSYVMAWHQICTCNSKLERLREQGEEMMNRVLTILATACLLAALVMSLPAFGEGVVLESEATATHVTLTVLGDIRDALKLGFSHEDEGQPAIAETRETAWNFGTVIPQEGALGASEFSKAATRIEGYVWVIDYQSNAVTQCSVECNEIGDNDISLLCPFFWLRTWTGSDFTGYFQPEPGYFASRAIPPSYAEALTFPTGTKIDMLPSGEYIVPDPWSVKAGKYEIEVTSKWSLWPFGDGAMPQEPVVTRVGYLCLTVANVIGKELGIGIGTSCGVKPERGTYTALEVGEDWTGAVYPWVLDYRSNSDFDMEVEIPPITFQGRVGALDIRKYMKHYGWTGSGLEATGRHMYPSVGERYTFRDRIHATLGNVISFPGKIELDLSGAGDRKGQDRWKTPAGAYRPTDDISVSYSCQAPGRTITAHTFTINPLDFQVIVPERQDGYELPESGRFLPEGGIKPEGKGFYEHMLRCCQNHDRNVELSWRWSREKVGTGKISWKVFWRNNVEEDVAGEGQVWKGIFKYSPEGNASELGYSVTYEPDWTDPPGEKELIITMSHSPTV
jgi:hypothetical protein